MQSRSSRTFKTKLLRCPSFSLWSSKACYLEYIAPIFIFSIYSVELELHNRKVCFVHLCLGLTRIELSYLENRKMYLGGRHGLGLASTLVPLFYPCHYPICYYFGFLLVWRIEIWGDMFGTVFGGLRQFEALSGGLWKPVVSHDAQI
jgi:hypothetical protein